MADRQSKCRYYIRLLFEIYKIIEYNDEEFHTLCLMIPDMVAIEKEICRFHHIETSRHVFPRNYSVNLRMKWRYEVMFDRNMPLSYKYSGTPLNPTVCNSTCYYFNAFGDDRFLFVDIRGIPTTFQDPPAGYKHYWAPYTLFHRGIQYGQRHFEFLGGEPTRVKSSALDENVTSDRVLFTCWFFATRDIVGEIPPISIPAVRSNLGDFTKYVMMHCQMYILYHLLNTLFIFRFISFSACLA